MYNERIDALQKEVGKLHVSLDQQGCIERELRDQNDQHRKKVDQLQQIVNKAKETERNELIELQLKLSQS